MRVGWREGVQKRQRRKQRAGGTQLRRLLAGKRAERTRNMYSMFMTLEVSKLSGWLKADAPCRVERNEKA